MKMLKTDRAVALNIEPFGLEQKICFAASDYVQALNNASFAQENGGADALLHDLSCFVESWRHNLGSTAQLLDASLQAKTREVTAKRHLEEELSRALRGEDPAKKAEPETQPSLACTAAPDDPRPITSAAMAITELMIKRGDDPGQAVEACWLAAQMLAGPSCAALLMRQALFKGQGNPPL